MAVATHLRIGLLTIHMSIWWMAFNTLIARSDQEPQPLRSRPATRARPRHLGQGVHHGRTQRWRHRRCPDHSATLVDIGKRPVRRAHATAKSPRAGSLRASFSCFDIEVHGEHVCQFESNFRTLLTQTESYGRE
jgi:hypothetical protein